MLLGAAVGGTEKVHLAGTHRVRHPAQTWEVVEPLLGEFGITRVADITELDTLGVPVVMAVRPLSRTLSVAQGKGQTALLAAVSAVMESIELWHAEQIGPTLDIGPVPADELDLPYRLDQVTTPGSLVTGATPLDWLDGVELCSGRPAPVPADLVRFTSRNVRRWRPFGLLSGSNGLASGNVPAEAALHALYEVIERDAISAPGTSPSPLDPATIDDDACAELIDRIRAAGATLLLAHLPSRFQVPCFAAQVWSEDFPVLSLGWGAHLAADVAISRAVTEAAQSRLTAIAGSRDDLPPVYEHVRRGVPVPPPQPAEPLDWAEVASTATSFGDVADELALLAGVVARTVGADPIMVDLSGREDVAVVKVVAPGTVLDVDQVHPNAG